MSRSFGDKMAAFVGVICEPEITFKRMDENSRFIIIGSDGIWEYISNEEAMEVVQPFY